MALPFFQQRLGGAWQQKPPTPQPNSAASLTVWDASSSRMTLWVMTLVTAVLLPVVIAYTAYIYRVLRGPVTQASITANPHSY